MEFIKKLFKGKKVKLTKEQALFKIKETRFCMAHMVYESTAVSILALLLFIGAPSVFPEIINPYLPSSLKIMQGIVIVPTVFWILTLISNLINWIRIKKLSKLL